MCNSIFSFLSVVTVETGFSMNTLTVNEKANPVDMCLATVGNPVMDTIINVTVIYGNAGEEGEPCDRSIIINYTLRREKYLL